MEREQIGHHPADQRKKARGEWYVSREKNADPEWEGECHEYLHSDGVWRTSTYSGTDNDGWGSPTGYFATEDEARAALAKARGENV